MFEQCIESSRISFVCTSHVCAVDTNEAKVYRVLVVVSRFSLITRTEASVFVLNGKNDDDCQL